MVHALVPRSAQEAFPLPLPVLYNTWMNLPFSLHFVLRYLQVLVGQQWSLRCPKQHPSSYRRRKSLRSIFFLPLLCTRNFAIFDSRVCTAPHLLPGRYILILMGIFAIYTGFLYNDFFGMMISPFGENTFWTFPVSKEAWASDCSDEYNYWFANKTAGVLQVCGLLAQSGTVRSNTDLHSCRSHQQRCWMCVVVPLLNPKV